MICNIVDSLDDTEEPKRAKIEVSKPWVSVDDYLPEEGVPVLACVHGYDPPLVLNIMWEYPTYEDNFNAFQYWDCPINDGQAFEDRVWCWMPLPEEPTGEKDE